ncbi:methyl-accepting chemotaxis protein [Paenibacillus sp. IB182496]|uniref:Methyl-accepting chemotaxis protein n=1 Tax=Paenibacillus sabuli TaxID=2772509 RepID=A0A927BU22_9BACL|nr:methyl-accepting chemotaxis protein [Paenibacillus sabuli]MBD2845886.1 methyl-accepting chemotaxis protein [Paenibacillus sabuli]
MFDWLGFKKGLPLWWSYRLNAQLKTDVQDVFEGIADTRKNLLHSWTTEYWRHLERLSAQLNGLKQGASLLEGQNERMWESMIPAVYMRAADFSEIFLLDEHGTVVYSTYAKHIHRSYGSGSILEGGLSYTRKKPGDKCLFGPYGDPLTLEIGPRTSSFHDKMTLLFIEPIVENGEWKGALCGRVPNDVIGDLIQRESGHVYPDSGDNYIFMAKPGLNTQIPPGMALSRSRFEDRTFTHGENLKDGVTTDWGTVGIKEHTELEIMFTDPATGQLHPGVANTIRNGSNLFVEFPGYSDYRHIPVIGKGVTFQLPHCPDLWGMMCEGDLEEVYRIRGIGWRHLRLNLALMLVQAVLAAALVYFVAAQASPVITGIVAGVFSLGFGLLAAGVLHKRSTTRVVGHLHNINRFIRINAEGKGDLTQRLKTSEFDNDETRELAKWINNMIDSLEGIMLQVKLAAGDVLNSQQMLNKSAGATVGSTERVNAKIKDMIRSILHQLKDIDNAKDVASQMRETLRMLEEKAADQIEVAQGEVMRIGDKMQHISLKVEETNATIREFMDTTQEIRNVLAVIGEISAQTNLLALNASIEAARVGEHGRGFAVVASEIRKLADLTRKSTEEVHEIVENIYDNARKAFQSMEEGTQVVEEGNVLVAAASEILNSAKEEDSRKTRVVDEVVLLMEKIAGVSLDNRSVSTEVEGKVQELLRDMMGVRHTSNHVEAITAFLQQLVGQFQLTEARRR